MKVADSADYDKSVFLSGSLTLSVVYFHTK